MRKLIIASLLVVLSMQAHAKTLVFNIQVPTQVLAPSGIFYNFSVDTSTLQGPIRNTDFYTIYRYTVQHTSHHSHTQAPSITQKGPFNVNVSSGSSTVSCKGQWEYDFWETTFGPHDRFYLTLSPPCKVTPSNDASDHDSGLHHSGTYSVSVDPSLLKM